MRSTGPARAARSAYAIAGRPVNVLVDAGGWTGGVFTVLAYGLVALNRRQPSSASVQALNTVGGLLLAASAAVAGAIPNAVMCLVWFALGLFTLTTRQSAATARHHCDDRKVG